MQQPGEKARAFKAQVQQKIQSLLQEFASGEISQAQFDTIYDRYHSQLLLAEYAIENAKDHAVDIARSGPTTIAIREAAKGKALGLTIYHRSSGAIVETLGEFSLPPEIVQPILTEFALYVGTESTGRHIERLAERQWLLFTARHYTIVVTLFHNEPSPNQAREIQRLHEDFEEANHLLLADRRIDTSRLAIPFRVFVQQKLDS